MKLITWNVQWFCGLDGRVDVGRVLRTARALADFDVLCLQEVACNFPRLQGDASADQAAQVAQALPGYAVFYGAAVDELAGDGSRRRFGNLVATRLPALQVRHHPLPYPADASVSSMPRMATVVTLAAPFGPLRVMTTHLAYYSARQRLAQAEALCALHAEAAAQALAPPLPCDDGSPFENRVHAAECLLTADFNCSPQSAEYTLLQAGHAPAPRFTDCWRLVHGARPHEPTFRVFDRRYGPEPVACDFVFASAGLAPRVRRVVVDGVTQASDHQPVLVELDDGG